MIGILILFAVIFVLVLAFSSTKKQTTVRKIEPSTGHETIEIQETNRARVLHRQQPAPLFGSLRSAS